MCKNNKNNNNNISGEMAIEEKVNYVKGLSYHERTIDVECSKHLSRAIALAEVSGDSSKIEMINKMMKSVESSAHELYLFAPYCMIG